MRTYTEMEYQDKIDSCEENKTKDRRKTLKVI